MRGPRSEHTTAELIASACAGEQRSWEEIMARYGGVVRSVVISFRLQDADAADATQNTWLRAVQRLHTVRDPERFGGWLRTTARRECLALTTLSRREQPDDAFADQLVDQTAGPEAEFLRDEIGRAVRAAVDGLTGRRRRLVDALFYQPDGDYAVVSRATDMPMGSIGPTRARVLRSLRTRLEQGGFGDTDPVRPETRPEPRREPRPAARPVPRSVPRAVTRAPGARLPSAVPADLPVALVG